MVVVENECVDFAGDGILCGYVYVSFDVVVVKVVEVEFVVVRVVECSGDGVVKFFGCRGNVDCKVVIWLDEV